MTNALRQIRQVEQGITAEEQAQRLLAWAELSEEERAVHAHKPRWGLDEHLGRDGINFSPAVYAILSLDKISRPDDRPSIAVLKEICLEVTMDMAGIDDTQDRRFIRSITSFPDESEQQLQAKRRNIDEAVRRIDAEDEQLTRMIMKVMTISDMLTDQMEYICAHTEGLNEIDPNSFSWSVRNKFLSTLSLEDEDQMVVVGCALRLRALLIGGRGVSDIVGRMKEYIELHDTRVYVGLALSLVAVNIPEYGPSCAEIAKRLGDAVLGIYTYNVEEIECTNLAVRGMMHRGIDMIDRELTSIELGVQMDGAAQVSSEIYSLLRNIQTVNVALQEAPEVGYDITKTATLFSGWLSALRVVRDLARETDMQDYGSNFASAESILGRYMNLLGGYLPKEEVDARIFLHECCDADEVFNALFQTDDSLCARITVDRGALKEALCELTLNADRSHIGITSGVDYVDPGNGLTTIRARKEGNELVIQIKDEGSGIKQEDLIDGSLPGRPRIFDMGMTTTGGGLGLSQVWWLIRYNDATIEVESQHIDDHPQDHGTTFTIRLPLAQPEAEKVGPEEPLRGSGDIERGA